jgi:hypothetical protein
VVIDDRVGELVADALGPCGRKGRKVEAMTRRDTGPRRSDSVNAYRRRTRALAALALFALVGGIVSDELAGSFWGHHSLLAGLVASVIVVLLTVALVNEAIERRSRQRWRVLAQYVMLQLVRETRLVWTGLAELAGLMPADAYAAYGDVLEAAASIDEGSGAVRDTARLTAALCEVLTDEDRRRRLHDKVAFFVNRSDDVLGRWAGVMLNADVYAEVIDRHVELAGDLAWLGSLLSFEFSEEDERAGIGRSHPAALIEGTLDNERLVRSVAAMTQLAEQLDRNTLALALQIVPIEWWRTRLGASALTPLGDHVPSIREPSRP